MVKNAAAAFRSVKKRNSAQSRFLCTGLRVASQLLYSLCNFNCLQSQKLYFRTFNTGKTLRRLKLPRPLPDCF